MANKRLEKQKVKEITARPQWSKGKYYQERRADRVMICPGQLFFHFHLYVLYIKEPKRLRNTKP